MPQLVRKRPFAYPGYSDQARTNMDFGDPDALELDELQDKDLSDLAREYEANAPVTKALWKPKNFKSPVELADSLSQRKVNLDFTNMSDDELLSHFINSSGWGFTGTQKNGKFRFNGPDWDKTFNPMSREQVIDELNERKRIDEEEDGDWFDYLFDNDYGEIDADYERSFGAVDTPEKYQAYLKWLKQGN